MHSARHGIDQVKYNRIHEDRTLNEKEILARLAQSDCTPFQELGAVLASVLLPAFADLEFR